MAVSKSQKIQAEIDKVKAKISEQQARLKELEKNKQEAENSEIVDWCSSGSGTALLDKVSRSPRTAERRKTNNETLSGDGGGAVCRRSFMRI